MNRQLVERAIEGDFDAFADLVAASASRQYAVATLILRDRDRAHDAVQDALVAAWRGLSALRDPDAWDAWVYRLTVRACFVAARRQRRGRELRSIERGPEVDADGAMRRPQDVNTQAAMQKVADAILAAGLPELGR